MVGSWLAPVVATLILAGGLVIAQQADDVEQALRDLNQAWMDRYNEADFEGFSDLHTEDFLVRHANGVTDTTEDAMMAWWEWARDLGLAAFVVETEEAAPLDGTYGFSRFDWSAMNAAGEAVVHGEGMVIARLQDGEWKIFRLFSGSLPPPAEESQEN